MNRNRINKKIIIGFALIIIIPFIQGCDFSYSVFGHQEAIITQDGKIVKRIKKQGIHYKIPFYQKVHIINVFTVREVKIDSPEMKNMNAQLYWHVNDSIKFFNKIQSGITEKSIEKICEDKFTPLLQNINKNKIIECANLQKIDAYYTNNEIEKALNELRIFLVDFGIKIRLYLKFTEKEAQQSHSS